MLLSSKSAVWRSRAFRLPTREQSLDSFSLFCVHNRLSFTNMLRFSSFPCVASTSAALSFPTDYNPSGFLLRLSSLLIRGWSWRWRWYFLADRGSLVTWRTSRWRQLNLSAPLWERQLQPLVSVYFSLVQPVRWDGHQRWDRRHGRPVFGFSLICHVFSLLASPLLSVSTTQGEHGSRVTPGMIYQDIFLPITPLLLPS